MSPTYEIGKMVLELKGPYCPEWKYVELIAAHLYVYYNIKFTIQSMSFLWHVAYFGICIGSVFHPIVASF